MLTACPANGSDSKKQRLDEAPPSRVLHIRKLPNEVSETEVIALGLPFGKVTNILMLKGKNQVTHSKVSHSQFASDMFPMMHRDAYRPFWSWRRRKLPSRWSTTTRRSHHRSASNHVPPPSFSWSLSGMKTTFFSLRSGAKRHRVHPVLQPQRAEDGLGTEPGETFSTLVVLPHLKWKCSTKNCRNCQPYWSLWNRSHQRRIFAEWKGNFFVLLLLRQNICRQKHKTWIPDRSK